MIRIAHLLDDGALGGVTRFLDALEARTGPAFSHERHVVSPRLSIPASIKADAIVVHFAMSWAKLPFLLALRTRASGTPVILVEHGYSSAFERLYVPAPRRFRAMLSMAYASADRVVAVSYGQAQWMRQASLLPASKLWIVRPFTKCESLAAVELPQPAAGPLRLGAFGRYCAQKNFGTLVEAMRVVDPTIATLTLRGFGPDADALRLSATGLPHVSIGDAVDDLGTFLSQTDAIVVPSAFEPFGQVALEARLAARPLIVTDVDGLPEQADPRFALVVPPSAPETLAAAIETLAKARREDDWAAMCNAARASAADHIDTSAQRWRQLLLEVCHQQPARAQRKPALAGV